MKNSAAKLKRFLCSSFHSDSIGSVRISLDIISFGIVLFKNVCFCWCFCCFIGEQFCCHQSVRLSFFALIFTCARVKLIQTASVRIFRANNIRVHSEMISSLSHKTRCHLLLSLCFCFCVFFCSFLSIPFYGGDAQYYISLLFGINVLLNSVYIQIIVAAVYFVFSPSVP